MLAAVFLTLLLSYCVRASTAPTSPTCILQGPEPELQIVKPGRSTTFICLANASSAHWVIDGDAIFMPIHYGNPHMHYLLTRTTGEISNLTATIHVSRNLSRGEIFCACKRSLLDRFNRSRTAQWLNSCLLNMTVNTLPSSLTMTPIPSSNYSVAVVEVQFPAICLMETTMYYKLIAENTEALRNTSIEGSMEVNSRVFRFTTSGLERNRPYNLYLMARTYTTQEWYLIAKWHNETSPLTTPTNTCFMNGSSLPSCKLTSEGTSWPPREQSSQSENNSVFGGEFQASSTSFIVVLVLLGALLLLLIATISAVAGGLILRKHKRKRGTTQRTMVNNPIYDGPMYESIHPQFRLVRQQTERTTVGERESVKAEGDSRESEHDTELSLPDELATPDQELSPRYVRNPKSQNKDDQEIQLADISLTLSPIQTPPTQTPPTLTPAQSQHRERNVLGLTLNLSETNGNGVGVVRGYDIVGNNGRQTRKRAATASHSRPLLLSYLSSNSSTPSNDDNYTVMSPVTHVPVLTADGTSFLRGEKRAYRDRCTTLI